MIKIFYIVCVAILSFSCKVTENYEGPLVENRAFHAVSPNDTSTLFP